MNRKLTLTAALLSALVLLITACGSDGNRSAKTMDGKVTGGTYKFGDDVETGPVGTVLVYPLPDNSALFFLELSRGAPSYNSGQLDGLMTIKDGAGTYTGINEYNDCILKFKFTAKQLEIATEDGHGNCGFGGLVYAGNTYELIDKSIPQYYLNAEGDTIFFKDVAAKIAALADMQAEPSVSGSTEDAGETVRKYVRNLEFNGGTVAITGFPPDGSDEDENIIDSLSFVYNGTKHTIRLPYRGGEEAGPWYFVVSLADYNFDNHMDIAIMSSRGVSNQLDDIYIYDPQTKSYNRHNELSGIMNVWADKETKTLRSHAKGGHAGMIYNSVEYKWEKGVLTLIRSEDQDYDNSSETYIRITKTLQKGQMVQTTDTIYSVYDAEPLIDARDGQKYRTVKIEERTWMARNLNFAAGNSRCYNDNPSNCDVYGRMYTWDAAMTVCPAGWRLPAREDWNDLTQAADGDVAGKKLKSQTGWGTDWNGDDYFGFSALPGGFYNPINGFYNRGDNAGWWSTAEDASGKARCRYVSSEGNDMGEDSYAKDAALSVRCVKGGQ
ncbi:MAG: fibrobacter succinogenes major paralogous domain-containing protein [Chitinispirillia bacterium]|nr:fibrobacter succinogenes major paralogous domain-containing protein [Chitinispirillia bacterium]MCL2242010.1 fibrobacter succinogenes major paralogous domain-containing protein [Chitinispirillia bacterium]